MSSQEIDHCIEFALTDKTHTLCREPLSLTCFPSFRFHPPLQWQLSSLYEIKPPISKAKMSQVTKAAIKGIKMYKHVVQSVERFIQKCKAEYKLPGLYVIDSIVRQSRHQYGPERDVFGPRFMRNFKQTFQSLFSSCNSDDKPKIVRVLNLWQHNNVFPADVIQPLLDMANPNAPLRVSDSPPIGSAGDSEAFVKHLQQLAHTMGINRGNRENNNSTNGPEVARFNKKLLEYNYDDDEDDEDARGETPTEAEPPVSETLMQLKQTIKQEESNDLAKTISKNLLMHPDLLKRLSQIPNLQYQPNSLQPHSGSQLDQTISNALQSNSLSQLIESFQSGHKVDPASLIFNDPSDHFASASGTAAAVSPDRLHRLQQSIEHESSLDQDQLQQQHYSRSSHRGEDRNDRRERRDRSDRSRSRSPRRSRFNRRSRSRSRSPYRRERDRDRYERGERRSDRLMSPASLERERERERRKKGLPEIRAGHFTICTTTLFLGHLPKLVSEDDITDLLKEYGEITSIELIPPRGCAFVCMQSRSDAYRILSQASKHFRIHGSYVKMAWAAGKGMKAREYKDLWHLEQGASYIPHHLLTESTDLDLLAEGGMIDEDSLPAEIRQARALQKQKLEQEKAMELMQQEAASNDSPSVHTSDGTPTGMPQTQPPPPPPSVPINFSVPPPNMSIPPPPVMPDVATMHHQPPPPPPPPHNASNKLQANPLLVLNNPVPLLTPPPPLPPALFSQPPPPLSAPPPQFSRPPPPLPWPVRPHHPPPHQSHSGLTGANNMPLGIPIRGIRPGLSLPLPHGPEGEMMMQIPVGSQFNPKILPPRVPGDQDADLAASDDPFAPSVYELKAMERVPFQRGLLSPIRPLIPGVRFDEPPPGHGAPGRGPPFPGNGRWENQHRGSGGRDYSDRRNDRGNNRGGSSNGGGEESPAARSERPTGIRISRNWSENSGAPNGSDNDRSNDKSDERSHQIVSAIDHNNRVKNEPIES